MDSTVKRKERCIIMYKITNNIKTYHNHTYAFVSKLKKGEVKQYDCFTWIYRMEELDNADYSINVVVFNFEGVLLLTLALDDFRLIGLKETDVLSEEMLKLVN